MVSTLKYLLSLLSCLCLVACSNSGNGNDTATIEADSIVMAMDTATAITVETEEPIKPAEDDSRLDSLASAETAMEFMKNSGHWAEYQQGIIPSILEQNLDYGRRLLRNKHQRFIIVDKESMQVILYDKYGREEKSYLMACSRYFGTKHKRRDNRTPEGFFSAEGVYNSTDWLYTDDDGHTSPARGQFGPRFIRVKNPVTTQVGIHGTSSPNSPGKRVSHGCIRIQNQNILELVKYVTVGMPIIINPSERDQKVNRDEGYNVVKLNIGKGTYKGAGGTVQKTPEPEPETTTEETTEVTEETIVEEVTEPEKVETPESPVEKPDTVKG